MYCQYFNLKEKPFNVTPDPDFLYLSRKHEEALSHMLYGIKERKGFLEITGEIGTGKTTLCRVLLNRLDKSVKTSFILNASLAELQFLEAIITDLGLVPKRRSKIAFLNELNRFLLDETAHGNNVVLIIDEAQNLKPKMLEHIRLLSNLETQKEKLLQIVLVGQPQLREKLKSPGLAQLRQRVGVRYHILPLDEDEVARYINHRLEVAGWQGNTLFEKEAVVELFSYSGGVPRLINIVCDRALLLCFVREQKSVGRQIIEESVREIENRE